MAEVLLWCIVGAAFGYALGAVLAAPASAIRGLRDGVVQIVMLPARMVRRDR